MDPEQHLKWQKGTETAALGGPRYQVSIDGQHSRQVNIDHLKPGILQNQNIDMTVKGPIPDFITEAEEPEASPITDVIPPTNNNSTMNVPESPGRPIHSRS